MKAAIIGVGTMGRKYADCFKRMKGVTLAGALAASMESAEKFASDYGGRGFVHFDELMQETDPDVVCITLPTYLHKEFVLKAATYRKPIICEKPIALSVEDAAEMISVCERLRTPLYIGHVVRFFPEYAALHQTIRSGEVGKALMAHTKRAAPYPVTKSGWYDDDAKSGGIIMDLLIHDMDMLRWIIGEVTSAFAMVRRTGSLQHAFVTLRFATGAAAHLEGIWGYPRPFTTSFEVVGDRGIVSFDSPSAEPIRLIKHRSHLYNGQEGKVELPPAGSAEHDPYYRQLQHFFDCIRFGTKPIVTAQDAARAVDIAQKAIRSAEIGLPIATPISPGTNV